MRRHLGRPPPTRFELAEFEMGIRVVGVNGRRSPVPVLRLPGDAEMAQHLLVTALGTKGVREIAPGRLVIGTRRDRGPEVCDRLIEPSMTAGLVPPEEKRHALFPRRKAEVVVGHPRGWVVLQRVLEDARPDRSPPPAPAPQAVRPRRGARPAASFEASPSPAPRIAETRMPPTGRRTPTAGSSIR